MLKPKGESNSQTKVMVHKHKSMIVTHPTLQTEM